MSKSGLSLLLIFLSGLFACRTISPDSNQSNQGLIAQNAMVVSAHPLASMVGKEIIKQGGNAVDAAIAVQFALAVVYPSAGNIGGGGFMVIRLVNGDSYSIDYREKAPAKAHRDMYLSEQGEVIGELSWLGHLAAGVPGVVDGMFIVHDSLGNLPMSSLIQPAIDLAEFGFLLTEKEANKLNRAQDRFEKYNTMQNAFINEVGWQEGDTIYLTDLAKTLKLIRDQGRAGFYEGETADKIVEEMIRGKGIISHQDLKDYRAVWRQPLKGDYKGYGIISMGPPSSGGIALLQLLKCVEHYDLNSMGFHSAEAIHLITEAERRVYADRATHLGDRDYYPVPIGGLLQHGYLSSRMEDFDPSRATPSDSVSAGSPTIAESEQTTHFSIVDTKGNAVSVTTTINGGFGSYVVVGGAGFLLNNEMDDFSIKPGYPNNYGLVGAEANAIEPGKRMLSSMTPTIVEKNGQLKMVLGTPGGATIITSVFQTIINALDYGMGMQAAVEAPRFHHQWKPDLIQHEPNVFTNQSQTTLANMGHAFRERSSIGRVDAILVLPNGEYEAGADPRGDDAATGF